MFDLDGTLADTLGDIMAAANHAFTQMGQPAQTYERFRYLAGQGLSRLFTDALPPDECQHVEVYMQFFRDFYAQHNMDTTCLYPGIADLLDAISAKGLKQAILTNKPDTAAHELTAKLMSQWNWDVVLGHRQPYPVKPDPTSALAICDQLGIAPEHWLYVGDTRVDMETAKNAGMFAIGVLWGFRDEPELRQFGADLIVRDVKPIIDLL